MCIFQSIVDIMYKAYYNALKYKILKIYKI